MTKCYLPFPNPLQGTGSVLPNAFTTIEVWTRSGLVNRRLYRDIHFRLFYSVERRRQFILLLPLALRWFRPQHCGHQRVVVLRLVQAFLAIENDVAIRSSSG